MYFVAALHRALHTRQLRRQVWQQHQELERYAQSLEQLVEQRTREFLAVNEAMEMLVRDALDTSLVESHTLILHRSRCDLVEVCQQVLAAYTAEAGRALDFEVGREPVEVEIDRDRISQVLIHLIFTARKASRGGAPLKVMLHQTSTQAIVTLGEMMGEEVSEHPLERFYRRPQAEVPMPTDGDGGIGLFLAQHIVAKHEGQIQIQNSPEQEAASPCFYRWQPSRQSRSVRHSNRRNGCSREWSGGRQALPHSSPVRAAGLSKGEDSGMRRGSIASATVVRVKSAQ